MTRRLALLVAPLAGCMPLDGFFFNPTPVDAYAFPDTIVPSSAIEEVRFETEDGVELFGVWARQDPPAPPMIFFHGNTGNLETEFDRVEAYWAWGRHDIFAVDYRGYGRSGGDPTYDGVLEQDGAATVRYVVDHTGVAPEQIPWVGHSMGAAVSVHTNDEWPAQSVVVESMFASAGHILDHDAGMDLPTGWFFEDPFDNVAAIADLQSPVFVVHGQDDDYIQVGYAQDVYDAAPEPKELWTPDGVDHSDILEVIPAEYHDRIVAFQDAW